MYQVLGRLIDLQYLEEFSNFASESEVDAEVDGSEPLHRCAGLRAPECGDGSQAALCSAQEYGTQCSTEGVAQEPKV
eukprot:COSAG06_NODE_7906_length_2336_cov_3.474743_3_plen_77_part_00